MGVLDSIFKRSASDGVPSVRDLARAYEQAVAKSLADQAGTKVEPVAFGTSCAEALESVLPAGEQATVVARKAGLLQIDGSLIESDRSLFTLAKAAGFADEWVNHYRQRETRVDRKATWADVLAVSPDAVKNAFGIPTDASPQETVSMLSETLVRKAVEKKACPSVLLVQHNTKVERDEIEARKREAAARPNEYAAAIASAGRPTLSDVGSAPGDRSVRVGDDGPLVL